MVKFIVLITKLFISTLVTLLFASCHYQVDFGDGLEGNGNVTTENRTNDANFTSVEVSRGLEVEIEQSDTKSVTVIADSNLQNHISTSIENGVLSITTDENIKSAESKKIIVKMPNIEALQSSSAADIKSINIIRSDNLNLTASSGSEMDISLEGENLTINTSSGSEIAVSGKVLNLETTSSSGSEINAQRTMSNEIIAKASSGSSIHIYPLVRLNATASSGANVSFHNIPKNQIKRKSSSGGTIRKE